MSIGVEEASGKLVGNLQHRRFAEEGDLGIIRDPFGSGEDLEGHQVALGPYDLGQFSLYDGQFVVGHALGAEGDRRLGDAFKLGIYFLICFVCHVFMRSFC